MGKERMKRFLKLPWSGDKPSTGRGKGYILTGLFVIPVLLVCHSTVSAAPGETALPFLRLGVGARECASGQAAVSFARSPASFWWNPALLSDSDIMPGISAGYNSWIEGISSGHLFLLYRKQVLSFGTGIRYLGYGTMERRGEDPGTSPDGSFDAADLSALFSMGMSFGPADFGCSVKLIHERIESFNALGWAFDAGLAGVIPVVNLKAGIAVRNLGPDFGFDNAKYPLPTTLRAGLGHGPRPLAGPFSYTAASDVEITRLEGLSGGIGIEVSFENKLYLSTGWRWWTEGNADSSLPGGFTAGFGAGIGQFQFSYNLEQILNEFGYSHRFDVMIFFM